MTTKQKHAIERLRKMAIDQFMYGKDKSKYEFKQFEVSENEYFVALVMEVGLVGDEGTMASIICRDYVHLFVGKRGGITYPVNKKNGAFVRRSFKSNLYSVAIAQRI